MRNLVSLRLTANAQCNCFTFLAYILCFKNSAGVMNKNKLTLTSNIYALHSKFILSLVKQKVLKLTHIHVHYSIDKNTSLKNPRNFAAFVDEDQVTWVLIIYKIEEFFLPMQPYRQ